MSEIKHNQDESVVEEMGFNDSELQDIMNEIESLEKEFVETAPTESLAVESPESLVVNPEMVIKTDLQKQIEEEMNAVFEDHALETSENFSDTETVEMGSDLAVDTDLMEADEILESVEAFDESIQEENIPEEGMEEATFVHAEPMENDIATNIIEMSSHAVASNFKEVTSSISSTQSPVSLACEGNMTLSMSFKLGSGDVKLNVRGEHGVTLSFAGVEVHMTENEGCVVEMENGVKFQIPLAEVKSKKNVA